MLDFNERILVCAIFFLQRCRKLIFAFREPPAESVEVTPLASLLADQALRIGALKLDDPVDRKIQPATPAEAKIRGICAEYFLSTWAHRPKPYVTKDGAQKSADRQVSGAKGCDFLVFLKSIGITFSHDHTQNIFVTLSSGTRAAAPFQGRCPEVGDWRALLVTQQALDA